MGSGIACCVTVVLLVIAVSAQPPSKPASPITSIRQKLVTVDGQAVSSKDVLVVGGQTYLSVPAIADAFKATTDTNGGVIEITTRSKTEDKDVNPFPGGLPLSDKFRQEVMVIPDELESLRWFVLNRPSAVIGNRFEDIDHRLTQAKAQSKTKADESVYYALTHANTALAIMYYKVNRGVSQGEAKEDELDVFMCGLDSKMALVLGKLMVTEGCSVLERMVGKPEDAQMHPTP